MFADVVVNRPTHRRPPPGSDPLRGEGAHSLAYTYRVPEHLRESVAVGQLVQVPLGASTAIGVITGLATIPPQDLAAELIRGVGEILDSLPVVTPAQIELARWIAAEYLEPLSQAMRLMLPPGLESRTFIVVTPTDGAASAQAQADADADLGRMRRTAAAPGLTQEERAVLRLLGNRGGRLRLASLLRQSDAEDPEAIVDSLAEKGLVDVRFTLVPPRPAPKRVQYVSLLADEETIEASLPRLGHPSKQADVLLALSRRTEAPLTVTELCKLVDCSPASLRPLGNRGWIEITERRALVVALPAAGAADLGRARRQEAVLSALLRHGRPIERNELLAEAATSPATIAALERRGLVQQVTEEPTVLLVLSSEQVMDQVVALRGAEKEWAVLSALRGTTGRVWVGGIYAQTGADLSSLRRLAERGLVSLHTEEYDRPHPDGPEIAPHLTPDQELVWRRVEQGLSGQGPIGDPMGAAQNLDLPPGSSRETHRIDGEVRLRMPYVALLHGVTGSGKTEIYLRALDAILAAGRRAVVLVPEISLTAQTVRRFEARFPGRVAVLHSQLSLGHRYAVWDRVRRGEADVLIGPRSALFAPISRLGLVVVDEAHDDSYKQSEPIPLPAYHTRDVALALGRLTGAAVLFGSATPDLVTYYRATQGDYELLELPKRIIPGAGVRSPHAARGAEFLTDALPPVRIVDLRQELRAGNRSIFSRALQEALDRTLGAGEQAILFLNRRGAATFVLCRDCGYVARCPNCDVPLTFHRLSAAGDLVCHRCNHREPPPSTCPACGGRRIRYFGLGTERVEETVRQLHPQARLLRWDRDTASGPDHERFLQAFVEHRADVLVGTQMIAKGLDLPLVTLVGVISADTAIHLPDYRAAERTFQLLVQVAGRAGRSRRGGRVIVQTYSPDHYAIRAAAQHDYGGFCRQELADRQQMGYPPFSRLVALRFSDKDPYRCRVEAQRLGRWLSAESRRISLQADLIGPAPCFFSRVQGRYRWQIVIRALDPMPLLRDVALPRGWQVDVDPVSLL